MPNGSFTIAGSAKNWKNELYDSTSDVKVQAVATNGTVLAETSTKTVTNGGDALNFALIVPLSTTATDKTAAVGDTVRLAVLEGVTTNIASDVILLASSGGYTNVTLRVMDVLYYDSSSRYASTEGKVPVSRAYIDGISAWLDGAEYTADGDYDGDGQSNYAEYLAGTNPFDETDYLHITDANYVSDKLFTLSFEYVGGHVYGVYATPALVEPAWMLEKTAAYSASDDDVGVATIELVPVEGESSRFYKLEAEQ